MESNVNLVLQAVTTVGFPIVACCVAFYLLWLEQKNHKSEVEKFIQALDKNTAAIEKLMERLK